MSLREPSCLHSVSVCLQEVLYLLAVLFHASCNALASRPRFGCLDDDALGGHDSEFCRHQPEPIVQHVRTLLVNAE
jgi:hypothetical protein